MKLKTSQTTCYDKDVLSNIFKKKPIMSFDNKEPYNSFKYNKAHFPSSSRIRYRVGHILRTSRRLKRIRNWIKARLQRSVEPKTRTPCCHPSWICLCFMLVITSTILFFKRYNVPHYSFTNTDIFSIVDLHPHKCNYPTLDPFNKDILRVLQDLQAKQAINQSSCPWETNGAPTSFVADHKYLIQIQPLRLNKYRLNIPGDLPTCCYTPFYRVTDSENRKGSCIQIISNVTRISEEFVELNCHMPIFHTPYRDAFAFIPNKPEVEARVGKIPINLDNQMSVILLGLDSVSHMHFIRQMSQSHDYLLKELRAISLNGYTKVAENTLPNVIPLLCGMTLAQFEKICIPPTSSLSPSSEINLDNCPFIWKDFGARGFRTSYAEDQNHIGIFHMYWSQAFLKQPTDYYLRTFTSQTENTFGQQQCQGSRTSFKVLLDNVVNMAKAMTSHVDNRTWDDATRKLYFQYTWSTRLSHDHIENLHYGDEDLLSTLKLMKEGGYLNKTIMILTSDHGSRNDAIRATTQGFIEDRMPFAYFIVPPWFHTKYPLAMKNLLTNADRLTTPFDIHQTLSAFWNLDVIEDEQVLNQERNNRLNERGNFPKYQSLFATISSNRTCFEAGIPLHWCLCNLKEPMDTGHDLVKEGMNFMLDNLNRFVKERSQSFCAALELQEITSALRWKDEKIDDKDQRAVHNDTSQQVFILELSFVTVPGSGAFEGTIVKSPHFDEGWTLTERIVRTNKYGDQSYCVDDYEIKEYCYCDDFETFK